MPIIVNVNVGQGDEDRTTVITAAPEGVVRRDVNVFVLVSKVIYGVYAAGIDAVTVFNEYCEFEITNVYPALIVEDEITGHETIH